MIIHLEQLSLAASSDLPTGCDGPPHFMPILVLLRMGFTRTPCLHDAGELLPHHFNLTTALSVSAECFCCTFPIVTYARRYLASSPYGARTFLVIVTSRDHPVYPFQDIMIPQIHCAKYILDTFLSTIKII